MKEEYTCAYTYTVLMILKASPTFTNNYTWSNVIIPETYLRVTDAYQYGGRLLTFEPALEVEIQI